MPSRFQILRRLPLPREFKTQWRRSLLDSAYGKDIATARKAGNDEKVLSLMENHRFELRMDEEEEDEEVTKHLIKQAQRLRVPIPRIQNEDGSDSDFWYEGTLSFRRKLTTKGLGLLREDIRKELKARHESKAVWLPWLSALTGLVGSITGLVALLSKSGNP